MILKTQLIQKNVVAKILIRFFRFILEQMKSRTDSDFSGRLVTTGLDSNCLLTDPAPRPEPDPDICVLPPVFVTLTCAFRYGREDLDVLGLTFRKDLFVANSQVFPPSAEPETHLTHLQERLMKKLGEHAHPFTFQVPSLSLAQGLVQAPEI